MSDMFVASSIAMAIAEEKIRGKREPIILERINLMQYLRPIIHSVLSFLFF
jgi:hypothetical protein